MGPYVGGQAEYVKVPFADFNALKLPPGKEHEEDFSLLADIFPTGWHGVQLSVCPDRHQLFFHAYVTA
jgi:threonine dehydrogenase-like Zn-dependent dehydrogenase